jgi:hypothetical protein
MKSMKWCTISIASSTNSLHLESQQTTSLDANKTAYRSGHARSVAVTCAMEGMSVVRRDDQTEARVKKRQYGRHAPIHPDPVLLQSRHTIYTASPQHTPPTTSHSGLRVVQMTRKTIAAELDSTLV